MINILGLFGKKKKKSSLKKIINNLLGHVFQTYSKNKKNTVFFSRQ
jgi:hypothetical protein